MQPPGPSVVEVLQRATIAAPVLDIVMVIDASVNVSRPQFELLQKTIAAVLDHLPLEKRPENPNVSDSPHCRVAIVVSNNGALIIPRQFTSDATQLVSDIMALNPSTGASACADAITRAGDLLRNTGRRSTPLIILFSNGATEMIAPNVPRPRQRNVVATELSTTDKIETVCIGIGNNANEANLRLTATNPDSVRFVRDWDEFRAAFPPGMKGSAIARPVATLDVVTHQCCSLKILAESVDLVEVQCYNDQTRQWTANFVPPFQASKASQPLVCVPLVAGKSYVLRVLVKLLKQSVWSSASNEITVTAPERPFEDLLLNLPQADLAREIAGFIDGVCSDIATLPPKDYINGKFAAHTQRLSVGQTSLRKTKLLLEDVDVNCLVDFFNLLILGPNAAGKSTLLNALDSILRGQHEVSTVRSTASGMTKVSKDIYMLNFKAVKLWDLWGWGPNPDFEKDKNFIEALLNGKYRSGLTVGEAVAPPEAKVNSHPTVAHRMHAVVICYPAGMIGNLTQEAAMRALCDILSTILAKLTRLVHYQPLVLLTKCDEIFDPSPAELIDIKANPLKLYGHPLVENKLRQLSSTVGISRNSIQPHINISSSTELHNPQACYMAMKPLTRAITFAADYVRSHSGGTEVPPTAGSPPQSVAAAVAPTVPPSPASPSSPVVTPAASPLPIGTPGNRPPPSTLTVTVTYEEKVLDLQANARDSISQVVADAIEAFNLPGTPMDYIVNTESNSFVAQRLLLADQPTARFLLRRKKP